MATYSTHDFYLSAFLIGSGIALAKHERQDGRSDFFFPKTKQLDELVDSYYNFKASINPLTYASAFKNLKGTMYNTTTNTNDKSSQQFRKV